jgi:hypothetical protein
VILTANILSPVRKYENHKILRKCKIHPNFTGLLPEGVMGRFFGGKNRSCPPYPFTLVIMWILNTMKTSIMIGSMIRIRLWQNWGKMTELSDGSKNF